MAKRLRENSISEPEPSLAPTPAARAPKAAQLDMAEETPVKMKCSMPPHKTLTFNSYADYETHYQSAHTSRCSECGKNFPTAHFLDLHQTENHDPIMATKRDQGEKTFSCFVEGCEKVCRDWQKRRSHLVDKHHFPRNYDFLVVQNGIDGKRSMLRSGVDSQGHRRSSRERQRKDSSATMNTQTTEATSVSQQSDDPVDSAKNNAGLSQPKRSDEKDVAPLDVVTKSISSLQLVPRSVTFGKRKGNSGFAKS